jgi:hypothetical protein
MISITPKNITINGSNISDPNNQQIWTSQSMNQSIGSLQLQNNLNATYWWSSGYRHVIDVIGLKPNTYHNFTFDGLNATSKCVQLKTSTTNTSGLLSDENGTIQFEFYNDYFIDWSTVTTTFSEQQLKSGLTPGDKSLRISSADLSSYADGVLSVAPWIGPAVTTEVGADFGLNTPFRNAD